MEILQVRRFLLPVRGSLGSSYVFMSPCSGHTPQPAARTHGPWFLLWKVLNFPIYPTASACEREKKTGLQIFIFFFQKEARVYLILIQFSMNTLGCRCELSHTPHSYPCLGFAEKVGRPESNRSLTSFRSKLEVQYVHRPGYLTIYTMADTVKTKYT